MTALCFCVTTFWGAVLSTHFTPVWYGIGLVFGTLVGWCVAYHRLRVMEKTLDVHIFCNGNIMKKGHGVCPSNKVFDRYALLKTEKRKVISHLPEHQQKAFDFLINIKDASNRPLSGTYPLQMGGENQSITFTNGYAAVALKAGESAEILDLPDGAA